MKRVTLDLDASRHGRLIDAAKKFGLTQQDLMVLVFDLTLTNLPAIAPHVERFKKRKEAEKARQEALEKQAKLLIERLTPEQQSQLLSGSLTLPELS